MLVKIGEEVVINMLSIHSVVLKNVEHKTSISNGFLKEPTISVVTHYVVEVIYKDADNRKVYHTYDCLSDLSTALKVKNEIVSQVKEIDNVGATQLLEEAIRNN